MGQYRTPPGNLGWERSRQHGNKHPNPSTNVSRFITEPNSKLHVYFLARWSTAVYALRSTLHCAFCHRPFPLPLPPILFVFPGLPFSRPSSSTSARRRGGSSLRVVFQPTPPSAALYVSGTYLHPFALHPCSHAPPRPCLLSVPQYRPRDLLLTPWHLDFRADQSSVLEHPRAFVSLSEPSALESRACVKSRSISQASVRTYCIVCSELPRPLHLDGCPWSWTPPLIFWHSQISFCDPPSTILHSFLSYHRTSLDIIGARPFFDVHRVEY